MSMTETPKAGSSTQKFYTMRQLAERWQRDKRSIDRDIKSGNLVAHKFGKSVRIAEDDVLLYEAMGRKKRG